MTLNNIMYLINSHLKRSAFKLFFLMIFFTALRVSGQTMASPDSALQEILSGIKGESLKLQDAVQNALMNSTSVRIAEANYLAAQGAVRREHGFFDPEFFFNFNYEYRETPSASFFAGASILNTQQTTSQSGLRMSLPIGTKLELSLNTVRLKTNSNFAFLNPELNTFGNLSLRQPLLGGFTTTANKELNRFEKILEAEKDRYDQQVIGAVSEAEKFYWELYAAERDYAVQKLTYIRAESFLKETELRAKTGLIGPNQVASAKTFLAEQELILIELEEMLDAQSDKLASYIGIRPKEDFARYIPVDEPPSDFPLEPLELLIENTLNNNLNLKAAQKDVEARTTLVNAADWELLPSVDIVGSLGGSGLAGNSQDVIFGGDTLRSTVSGSLGDALSQVFKRDFPNWSVGVEVTVPIGFRGGLGEKDRLEAEVLSSKQIYIELSRRLEDQVRTAHRELRHGNRRLKVAGEGVNAAQEQVRIGLIEFQNGRSTAFELVRLGEDFAIAQRRYSEALVRTAKAFAVLKQLTSGMYPNIKKN